MTTPDPRRTTTAGLALAALGATLAMQPLTAPPVHAGVNCAGPQLPVIGGLLNDCDAPTAEITQQPNRTSHSPAAVFEMTTAAPDADDPGVTFECRLDFGIAPDALQERDPWADCSVDGETGRSLGRAAYLDLIPGDYTFSVRASDVPDPVLVLMGDTPNVQAEPTIYEFTVAEEGPSEEDQAGAPDTRVVKAPKRWHLFPYAEVRFRADEPALQFVCRLDGRRLSKDECAVDAEDRHKGRAQFTRMGAGPHRFEVQAIDLAGNIDPTPAVSEWLLPRNNTKLNKHSKHWQLRRGNGYFQTTYSLTKKKGARISQGTRGVREIVLVATKCPSCGKLEAAFGGKTIAKVDLRAKKEKKRKLIVLKAWRKPQSGRLELTVTSKSKRVVVEGVGFARTRP